MTSKVLVLEKKKERGNNKHLSEMMKQVSGIWTFKGPILKWCWTLSCVCVGTWNDGKLMKENAILMFKRLK